MTIARLRLGLMALAVVVVLQAIPTVLWLQDRLARATVSATLAAAPMAGAPVPSSVALAAPPCAAPTPAEAAVVPAVRSDDKAANAPARVAAAPGLVAGLVSIEAPVAMHVYSNGRLIGTTEAETILLPVGDHDLELVSEAVGFRARRAVTVQAGRTTTLLVETPRVPVHVNAVPWAEVWIDNQRIGETPIGNLQQTIGPHEIVFRHPELGERRMVVLVTLKEPARISMDLRKR